ncbi:MAG: ribosome maturation factor RimP [Clostridiales bacterium]|nr:ribosome maturation factor RimP [Clostridiales bacterium]
MKVKDIVEKTESYAAEIVKKLSLELVETEYVKEGSDRFLRVYIDKEGGVGINDCEKVSRELEAILDKEDFIEEAYTLEVSSPGLDRILKKDFEYIKYKGRQVIVRLYKAIDKTKKFQGELIGLEDRVISIKTEDSQVFSFKREDVAVCRLAVVL